MLINKWIIVDLDNTICDIRHRLPFIKREQPQWDFFNAACVNDPPIYPIIALVNVLAGNGCMIAIITGRGEQWSVPTLEWLERHHVTHDLLLMRKRGDFRSDVIVKRELLNHNMAGKDIWFALEDRDRVVEMWRDIGLTCLQVAKGEY
jgi:hypothetical protein